MHQTDDWLRQIMAMDRQGMVDYLCGTRYVAALEKDQQGLYLFGKTVFGKTGSDRAVCLIWHDNNDGCVNREVLEAAYHEIGRAGLKIPFLFFGLTCLYVSDDIFTFVQIPWIFQKNNPILAVLRGMSFLGKMRVPISHN